MSRIPNLRNEYLPVPRFIQDTPRGRMEWDPYSRLANDRIIFLGTPVDDTVANLIIAQLLILESEDPDKDVVMYINSPGGDMVGLFGIYDTMQFLQPPVATTCIGQAASAAAVLLSAGAPGMRTALPNARVLIHQPHGGAQGQSVDLEIQVRETIEMRERMVDILATTTGQARERIVADIDRDYILRGDDAVAYGLVDEVITHRQLHAVAALGPTRNALASP